MKHMDTMLTKCGVFPPSLANQRKDQMEREMGVPFWSNVGQVAYLAMDPIMSIQNSQITYSNFGFFGPENIEEDNIILQRQHNLLFVYNTETMCVQTNLNLSIKVQKWDTTSILLQSPAMSIILNLRETQMNPEIECCTSFYNKFIVKVKGQDCGDKAVWWLYKLCNKPSLRLALTAHTSTLARETFWNSVRKAYEEQKNDKLIMLPFSDVPIYKLFAQKSLTELRHFTSLDTDLMICKPNIIIKTWHSYEEHEWEWIKIGNAIVRNIKPWQCFKSKICPENLPVEMRLQLLSIYCELYQPGAVNIGDKVWIHLPRSRL
ncbi:mitochondrial amidoxime reducing component 2-like isoform X1 [Harpegnathos saltator]|uniref:mitochondrial amidoxime reducing component 2-like isoform X1 n=1 Tax=Harpegnathos saltator TaxID=610380 RepID=UPI000948FEBA|nr:mitochondrial amidoxime reducing component 2-like isoform X1 [Harpegnathos saltator]